MSAMGRLTRRLRLLTGVSQAELARRAGVSQAAVSRLESGHAVHAPMIVVQKIHLAMGRGLAALPPELLSPEVRRLMQVPIVDGAGDPELRRLMQLLARVRGDRRHVASALLSVVGQALTSVAGRRDANARNGTRPEVVDAAFMDGWMRSLGQTARELRQQAGLSQDHLARRAGVSQGALSRYEQPSVSTPLLVVMKVNAALRREMISGRLPASSAAARRLLSLENREIPRTVRAFETFPVTARAELEVVVQAFWSVKPGDRGWLLEVARRLVAFGARE